MTALSSPLAPGWTVAAGSLLYRDPISNLDEEYYICDLPDAAKCRRFLLRHPATSHSIHATWIRDIHGQKQMLVIMATTQCKWSSAGSALRERAWVISTTGEQCLGLVGMQKRLIQYCLLTNECGGLANRPQLANGPQATKTEWSPRYDCSRR